MFLTGKSIDTIEKQFNSELVVINEWFMTNRLSLNLHKTSYIIFGNKKHDDIKICFHDTIRQYETKFLGVILTSQLKWRKHINVVVK